MPEAPITQSNLRAAIASELRQQMTPYVLKGDQMSDDIRMLKWTVYGNDIAGEAGLVKSMRVIQTKLDTLIDLSDARKNQWKGMKAGLGIVGILSSIPALQILLPALGKLMGITP